MLDSYGRTVDYMRVSVTDRCNLKCRYCMPKPETEQEALETLTLSELQEVIVCAAGCGIRHIKVTGGEPLVRAGVVPWIARIKKIEGIETVTLTTNGMLLSGQTEALKQAGIDGINISLDTLDPDEYKEVTRGGDVRRVLEGIHLAKQAGISVKLNAVLQIDTWKKNVKELAAFADTFHLALRFIEEMPFGEGAHQRVRADEVMNLLQEIYGAFSLCGEKIGFGPATYYEREGFHGRIGLINAVSHPFCRGCNRIRLTSDGTLKPCLQSEAGMDVKSILRKDGERNERENELRACIVRAVQKKPGCHTFDSEPIHSESMARIGG